MPLFECELLRIACAIVLGLSSMLATGCIIECEYGGFCVCAGMVLLTGTLFMGLSRLILDKQNKDHEEN